MNFKTVLLSMLSEDKLKEISEEMVERFSLREHPEQLLEKLTSFVQSIQTISDEVNSKYKVKILQEFDDEEDIEEEGYWRPFLLEVESDRLFAADLMPFEELFTYQVEGLLNEVTALSEVIFELTFDGYTIDEQRRSIEVFDESLADL